jgi:DNA-directed RNA polymerase subunit RPC12/RpoP
LPYYICPNCKKRSVDIDAVEGFTPRSELQCRSCGFGFLFELMDDYYPAPTTGFVVCDANARILATGRDVFQLSGFQEGDLLGQDLVEKLSLVPVEGGEQHPAKVALEWGVRKLGEHMEIRTRSGRQQKVTADFFPAYDEDGGLLVALTPRSG